MNTRLNDSHLSVEKAREALRNGNRTEARQWAEHAASLTPQMEDPWLILAAVASPRASVKYLQTALKINPNSERARKGMEWATQRLRDNPQPESISVTAAPAQSPERRKNKPATKRNLLFPILLFGLGCIIFAAAAWSASSSPVLASILNKPAPAEPHPQVWAQAEILKPTYTPSSIVESQATPTPQLLLQPTIEPTEISVALPTDTPVPPQNTELPTDTSMPTQQNKESAPLPTLTYSSSISMSIVPDTPEVDDLTNVPLPTAESASGSTPETETPPLVVSNGERWIDVNLTQQMVYVYQGNSVVNSFLVSTGTWQSPTVTGQYHIYVKLRYTDMTGPGIIYPMFHTRCTSIKAMVCTAHTGIITSARR